MSEEDSDGTGSDRVPCGVGRRDPLVASALTLGPSGCSDILGDGSDDEPLHVQTTPYSAETAGLAAVERSTDRLVVEDIDGTGDYEFADTVEGTRAEQADKQVVREPSPDPVDVDSTAPADD